MTIYARVFLPFVLPLAVALLLAWWLATSLLADSLTRRLEDQLGRAVAELAAGRLPLSTELLDRLGTLVGAELVLIPMAGAGHGPLAAAALRSLAQAPGGGTARYRDSGAPYSLAVRPIATGLDPRYRAVAAGAALAEVEQASRRIARQLALAAACGLLVLAWVAHRAARAITRPIATIAALAERLATGDLQARERVEGARELVALGAAIEQMAQRLAHYQTELAERNRLSALGELAARVAHEIRNPLTAIKLHVELLAEAAPSPAERRTLTTVLNEVRRLELVVANTLSLGCPRAGQPGEVDLNALVAAVSELLRPQLAHRGIALESRLAPLAPARMDEDRVKQVLLNLLTNAADELPEGGRILVTTDEDTAGEALLLAVEDSGPGLASTRAPGQSGKPHGLGLGLAISREIAAEHGGDLTAGTSAELRGARFVLRLPRCPERAAGEAAVRP